ncbi:general odorant-binding protein 69a-like [Microplitis mediator]|uniref:general odorant-binding protein 69a-like n=1 Tax=Microplitis mediator TaxID=375433 RepID=UPI002552E379|nr:general odorant-binding protein 69a-like [Microplitis mediator]
MKIFAIVFAVCVVGAQAELTVEQLAKLREHSTACITETLVDDANVDAAMHHNIWRMDDPKLRCYFFCLLKKLKVMNEDGTLNEEITRQRLANLFPADRIDGVITKCKDMKGADTCETAIMMAKCHADERASLGSTTKSD